MKEITNIFNGDSLFFRIIGTICRVLIGLFWVILCFNIGTLLGNLLYELLVKLDILDSLERFLNWFIWV